MTDRLNDLKRGAAAPDEVGITIESDSAGLIGNDANKAGGGGAFMQVFFGDVEIVKSNINAVRDATKRIADINQQVVMATTNEKEHDISTDLTPLVTSTNKKASVAKQILQRLREDTERLKTSKDSKASEIRIRENLANTLTRKFVDVMKEYQSAQTKYKTDIKKKVRRQVQIIQPEVTDEQIDAVMMSGKGAEALMQDAILKGEAADAVQNTCMGVADKYRDVLALEASVAELHQMFLDFALLTEQQGELLDQIENQVNSASTFIEEANKSLVESIELQKSIRYKQCCVACFVLVVIGIIVAVVLGETAAKKGGHLRLRL